jgi:hypothetical protein
LFDWSGRVPTTLPDRRTLEELRTLYELYPKTRDVLVEGRHDVLFIRAYLRTVDCEAEVYDVDDRVDVPGEAVLAAGQDIGSRGRLLVVATTFASWGAASLCGTCIVDADRAYLEGDLPRLSTLLVTDYGSMEAYALNATTLDKFFSLVAKMDPQTSMGEILARLIPALVAIFAVRRVLHSQGASVPLYANFCSLCDFKRDPITIDIRALVSRSVQLGRSELDRTCEEVTALLRQLPTRDRRFVRGHDIAPMLIAMFGLRNELARPTVVEGALLGCIEWTELHEEEMFKRLRARVC